MRGIAPVVMFGILGLIADTTLLRAYVDPGTGSYVFQILIAGIVAASMGVRIFWGRLKAFFNGRFRPNHSRPDESND